MRNLSVDGNFNRRCRCHFVPRLRTAFILCWISLALLHAQNGRVQTQISASDKRKHEIEGTVVNSVTGVPISRALVELEAQSSRYAMTDANGAFRFESVAEGLVRLEAERPGFFKPTELVLERGSNSNFQIDHDLSGIVLTLVPQSEIAGRVRSIQGSPIQDFPVRLYERRIVDGVVQWEKTISVVCDDEGYFRFFGLSEGTFVISAGPERWRSRPPGAKNLGYPLVLYPAGRELSAASLFSITAGQQAEADFSLSEEPLFDISGEVAGIPAGVDTKVELSSIAGDPVPLVQPHPERHEFFGYATAGKYMLRASAEVNGQVLQATEPLTIGTNTTGIRVVLGPQLSIPVNLRIDSGNSIQSRNPNALGASIKLISTSAPFSASGLVARRAANRDPTAMEVAGAEPGSYSVEIASGNAYVRAATSGSTDLLQNDLLVPEDGRVEPIEVVLSFDGGEVSGNVKLAAGKGRATVLLVPERGSGKNTKASFTQATGDFRFEQVGPGDYLLLAFDRADDLEYKNPDVISTYRSSGVRVNVTPRQQVKATLEVIQLGK